MVSVYQSSTLSWKRRIARLYRVQKNQLRDIILIYHAVGDSPWSISTDHFKKQIQWLKKNAEIVSLTSLLSYPAEKNKTRAAITFDDGYACLYDTVLPILQAENVIATVYINTNWISDDEKMHRSSDPSLGHYPDERFLTWHEVKILSEQGWEIGSHGVDHIDLTKQTEEIINRELVNSKLSIEKKLSKPCVHFAYTWGRHNTMVENSVHNAGYQYATAAHHGVLHPKDNQYALPRMNVAIEYTQADFENMIKGNWDFLSHIHQWKKKLKIGAHV